VRCARLLRALVPGRRTRRRVLSYNERAASCGRSDSMRTAIFAAVLGLTGAGLFVTGAGAQQPVVEVFKTPT